MRLLLFLHLTLYNEMSKFLEIIFLQEAFEFLESPDKKHYEKIFYIIFERHSLTKTPSYSKS